MKRRRFGLKLLLRRAVVSTMSVVLSLPASLPSGLHAADYFWDANGTAADNSSLSGAGLGGTATWDTTTPAWWTPNNPSVDLPWVNGFDTGVFRGTAGTVSLGTNISAGGLRFNTTGFTIATGANTLTLANIGGTPNLITLASVTGATINGAIASSGDVVLTGGVTGGAALSTLTLNGTSIGGWTGATTINTGMTLSLAAGNRSLLNTSSISLNGGGLTLVNTTAAEGAFDRVNNSAPIAVNGGNITYTNTSGFAYAETLGAVSLNSGQLNVALTNNMLTGGQTLTLGGFTRIGTATATFSALATAPNTTTNQIFVTGAVETPVNEIVGPWATVGTAAGAQTDYAVFDSSGRVLPANVGPTAVDTLWTESYAATSNVNLSGPTSLTKSRALNTLRYSGAGGTLDLVANNLSTFGVLNGGTGLLSIAGTGVITTPTGGDNTLYLQASAGGISIGAPIGDNGSPVTLVVAGAVVLPINATFPLAGGPGAVTLTGTNTFTGGIVINNGGALTITDDAQLGALGKGITFNGSGTLGIGLPTLATITIPNRTITINNGAIATINTNLVGTAGSFATTWTGRVTGSGGLTFSSTTSDTIYLNSTQNDFQGPLTINGYSNATSVGIVVASLADSPTANGNIRFNPNTAAGNGYFGLSSAVATQSLAINNRQLELIGASGGGLGNLNTDPSVTLTVNTEFLMTSAGTKSFILVGTNTGKNAYTGKLTDNSGAALSVAKSGIGSWILSGDNTYTGTTTITAGTLVVKSLNSVANPVASSSLGVPSSVVNGTIVIGGGNVGGALVYYGSGETTDRVINVAGTVGGAILEQSGTGLLKFTSTFQATGATLTRTLTLQGTNSGNGEVAGVIVNGTGTGITNVLKSGSNTWSLTGVNTYTGTTTVTGGTLVLDASSTGSSTASIASTGSLVLSGGTFVFKGNDTGTSQTFAATTMGAGVSQLQVVGGSGGTALVLGAITNTVNNGALNISVSGTNPIVTSTSTLFSGLIASAANGRGGSITFTSGGTTSFATIDTGEIKGLALITPLPTTLGDSATNYILTGTQTQTATTTANVLQIDNSSPGTLTLSGASPQLILTMGGLLYTGSGGYTISGGTLRSGTVTASDLMIHNFGTGGLTIASTLVTATGATTVTLDGPGTTTLSGNSTYTGGTVAGGGTTLNITANAALGSQTSPGALTLNNATLQITGTAVAIGLNNGGIGINDRAVNLGPGGGTFDVTGDNFLTISGAIGGTGNLTKTGTGGLVLTGLNIYSGLQTNIQNGTLVNARPTGALPKTAMLTLGSGSNSAVMQLGDGSNAVTQTVSGLTTSGTSNGNAVVGSSPANSILNYAGSVLLPSTFSGLLGGTGVSQNNLSLVVSLGSLTLTNNNTFTGGTTLSGGTLNLQDTNALGAGTLTITGGAIDNTSAAPLTLAANPVVLSGANGFRFGGTMNLDLGAGAVSATNATTFITLGGSGSMLTMGAVTNTSGGTQTFMVNGLGNTLSLGGYAISNDASARALIISGTANVIISGAVVDGTLAPSGTLTYSGSGTLRLAAANTYSGATFVNSGTVIFNSAAAIGGSGTSVTVSGGAIVAPDYAIDQSFLNRIALASTGTVGLLADSSNNLDFSSSGTNLASMSLSAISAVTYSGILTPNSSVYRFGGGTGTLTIASILADSGGATSFVKTGLDTVALSSANTFTGVTTIGGGKLQLNSADALRFSAVNIGAAGEIAFQSGIGSFNISALSGTGNIALLDTSNAGVVLIAGSNNASTIYNGVFSGASGAFVKTGAGTLMLGGASTFGGGFTIASGMVIASNSATAVGAGTVTLGEPGSNPASLLIATSGLTYANPIVLATGATGLLTIGNTGTAVSTTFSGGVTGTNDFTINSNATTGTITFSTAPLNNAGAITLTGFGTGTTTITGGIGPNVTQISLASDTTSALTISGTPLTVNPTVGTTVINQSGKLFTLSGGTTGTGDLTITNNASAGGVTIITTPVNNAGQITLNGNSSVATTFSAPIGAAVTAINVNTPNSVVAISGTIDVGGGLAINSNTTTLLSIGTGVISGNGNLTLGAAGTGAIFLNGTNTFFGGVTILQGTVSINNVLAFGDITNTVTLGASSGTASATIMAVTTSRTYPYAIVLGGTSGTLTITNGPGISGTTYTGGITGSNNLTLSTANTVGALTFTTKPIDVVGNITIDGTAPSGAVTISGGVGQNVKQIILTSTSPALTVNTTALTVNSAGTTLINQGPSLLTVSGGIVGTGDLVLMNNGATTSGITISGTAAVNIVGSITNSGTGSGSVLLSAPLSGGSISGITQASDTSPFTVSSAITLANTDLTVTSTGAALLNSSSTITGPKNLSFIVNSTGSITVSGGITNAGSISVSGTGSGTVTLSGAIGASVTGINQNSATAMLVLTTASSFTSGVNINTTGTVRATAGAALGTVAGQVTFNAAGTLDLRAGAGTYTTGINTTNSGGTILIEPAAPGPGVAFNVSGLNTFGTKALNIGPGVNVNSGSYALTFNSISTYTGNPTFTLDPAFPNTLTLSGGHNLGGATRTLTFNGTNSTVVLSGAFSGAAGVFDLAGNVPIITVSALTGTASALRISGTGTYTFNGASTFTGGVILNNSAATLIGTVAGGFGSLPGQVIFNVPATLNLRAVTTLFTTGLNLVNSAGTVVVEPAASGPAVTHTLSGANTFAANSLTVATGSLASSGIGGLTLAGVTTLSAPMTFIANQSAGGLSTLLTLSGATNAGANSITAAGNATVGGGVALGATNFSTQAAITVKANTTGGAAFAMGAVLVGGRKIDFNNVSPNGGVFTTTTIGVTAGTNPAITFSGTGPITTTAITLAAGTFGNTISNTNSALTTFNGAFTPSGPTTINTSSAAGLTIASVAAGANPLVFTGSGNTTISGALTHSGLFANTGAGNVLVQGQTTPTAGEIYSNTGTGALTLASFGNIAAVNITGTSPISINAYQMLAVVGQINYSNTSSLTIGQVTQNVLTANTLTIANNGGTITVTNGVAFAIAGAPIAALAVSGTGTTTINGVIGVNSVGSNTSGGLTVSTTGAGSLTLTGNNVFTGIVTLNAGSLLKVSTNGNLGANATATRLTMSGGTLRVTESMAFAANGAAGISLGVTSFFSVDSGKTLTINQPISLTAAAIFTTTGAGDTTIGAGGVVNFVGTAGFANLGTGKLTLSSASGGITGSQNMTFIGTGPMVINGVVTGTGTIVLNGNGGSSIGAGAVTFGNANTSSGAITINAGTLIGIPQSSGSPFGTSNVSIVGGTLQLNPIGLDGSASIGTMTTNGNATVKIDAIDGSGIKTTLAAASLAKGSGSNLIFDSGTGTFNTEAVFTFTTAPVVATSGIIAPWAVGKVSTTSVDFLTYSSVVGSTGLVMYKGHSTLPTATGSNTTVYAASGITKLSANTAAYALRVDSGSTIQNDTGNTTLTIGGTGAGVASILFNGTGSLISTTNLALGALEGSFYTGGSNTISSDMSGSAGFTVYGPGTLNLSGSSSVSGTVTINNATLALGTSNNLNGNAITLRGTLRIGGSSTFISNGIITAGAGGGNIVIAGGTSDVLFNALNGTANGPVTLTNNGSGTLSFTGTSAFGAGLVTTTAGNIAFSGAYTATAVANTVLVVAGGTTTLTYSGAGTPLMTANVTGGTLVLNSLNANNTTALSNLLVNGGTVKPGSTISATGASLVSSIVTINSGTFDLDGFNATIGRLAGTGGIVTNRGSGARTLTINEVTAITTYAGVIQDGTSGTIGITTGSGSAFALTLTNANTYTGTTTINSLSGAGGIIVGNPNALQNTSVINNVVAGATGGLSFTAIASGLLSANVAGLSGPGITVAPATSSFQLNIGGNNANTLYSGVITTGLLNAYVNKVGTGNFYLGGLNTYLGYTSINTGSVELGVNNALPPATVLNIASAGTLEMNDFSQTIAGLYGTGTIAIGADFAGPTLTIGSANTSLFSGVISGLGSLVKTGAGTATFTGANTYTGTTRVSAGTLNLDYSVATPVSSILSSDSAVVLSGGTLRVTAGVSGSATQSLGGVTISPTTTGQIALANSVSGATLTVNLGAITRSAGSMLNITVPTVGTNTINTSSFGNSGLITDSTGSAFVTINNLNWAAKSGDAIVPVTYSPNVFGAGLNTDIVTTTPTLGGTTGSLRFNISSALTLSGNSAITSGGILVTAGVSTSATSIIGNGFNLAGPSGGDFVVYAGGTGGVTFSANLVDGPDGITGLTKSGTAFLALTGNNTYSGVTTILSNSLVFGSSSTAAATQYPTGPIINMATLSFNTASGTVTLNQTISGTGAITNTAGNTVLNGVISTTGTLTNTAGNLTLGGANTMSGATTLTAGTIILTNSLALQNSTVTPAAGTLQFSGITAATLGGLAATLTPTIALPAGFTLSVGNNNAAVSYSGTMTGSGNFTKIGTGIQTLTGLNTYAGTTTISNGGITLTFPAANTTNLLYNNSTTPGALIMGGGTTTNPTNATLTITGTTTSGNSSTQNFSGTTLATSSLDTLAITAAAGTTVNVGLGSSITRNTGSILAVTGWGSTTNLNYTGGTANALVSATSGPYAGTAFVILAPSDFGVSNRSNTAIVPIGMASATDAVYTLTSTTPTFASNRNVRADSATGTWNAGVEINSFSQAVVASTITVNGTAADPSKITSGAFLSQTTLTFTGGVIQSQSNEFVFYVGPNNVAISSVLQNKLGSSTPTNLTVRNLASFNFTLTGNNTYTGTTAIISGIATFSTPGPYTLSTSAIINNGFVRFAGASGTQTVNAVISGSGNLQLQAGTALFNANNTYAGSTALSASGTIQIGIDNALPITTAFSFSALTGAGKLDLNGFNQTVASLTSTGTQAFAGMVTNNSTTADSIFTFGDATNTAYNALMTDGPSQKLILVKQGTGTATLQGINTFTGGTTINAGTIDVVQGAKLSGLGNLTINGGALTLNTGSLEAFASLSGNSAAGVISLAPGTVLSIRQMTDATFAGSIFDSVIANDGYLMLAAGGNKTLTLTNSNYYGGPTTINGGILSIAKAASLGDGSASNTIVLAGGTLQSTASFSLGTTRTIALGAGGGTIDVAGSNVLTANGAISGTTSLTKINSGTLALASNNTFTGPTIVSGGTLVAGSVAHSQTLYQSTSVSVGNSATLIGTGTTLGTLSVATGGTISPGSNDAAPPTTPDSNYQYEGIGSFTAAAGVTLADQSTFTFQFLGGLTTMDSATQLANAGTNWDLLQTSTGTIDLGAGVITLQIIPMSSDSVAGVNPASSGSLTAFDFGAIGDPSYHWLIAYASGGGIGKVTYTGDPDINNHFSIDASQVYSTYGVSPSFASFYVTTVDNGIYLNYSAVPEPSSLLLSAIAGLAFAWRKRRKNQKGEQAVVVAIPA